MYQGLCVAGNCVLSLLNGASLLMYLRWILGMYYESLELSSYTKINYLTGKGWDEYQRDDCWIIHRQASSVGWGWDPLVFMEENLESWDTLHQVIIKWDPLIFIEERTLKVETWYINLRIKAILDSFECYKFSNSVVNTTDSMWMQCVEPWRREEGDRWK